MRIVKSIKNKMAFTLAEVLVVMGVIGVIAALTIPALVQKITNETFYSQFMKTYALLTSASQSLINDYNGDLSGQFSDTTALMNLFATKLKPVKLCPEGNISDCWNTNNINVLGRYQTLAVGTNDAAMILANGSIIRFSTLGADFSSTCQSPSNTYNKNGKTYTACDSIWLDVNGNKPPNELGRDTFFFLLYPTIPIVPDGVVGTEDYVGYGGYDEGCDYISNPTAGNIGITCGAKLLNDGKMNY